VARGTLLRDELEEIADEVRRAVDRGADVIFISGGLGPTADDLTLAAVARGLGLPLELHPEALRLGEQYDRFHASGLMAQGGLNPGREKMAWLPRGGVRSSSNGTSLPRSS
jgi:nicotinamide-nucleotide amidase